MGDFSINGKNVITQSGTDEPAMASNVTGGLGLTGPLQKAGGTMTGDLVPVTPMSHRNMIINGAMKIAQRATSVTSTNSTSYHTVDRFNFRGGATGVYTIEQSTDAPANFKNSTKITVTTPDTSIPSTSRYWVSTYLEGNDISHLNLGTSDAQQFTLSFYVKSSLTGTFSGGFTNNDWNRAYAFEYNISSANTWERKEITLTGDTSGTWLTTSSIGIRIMWSLGWGVDRDQSAGAWTANGNVAVIDAVQVIATNAATFQITGVQLELGSNATPFEHRSFGDELRRCQRYYEKSYDYGMAVGTSSENGMIMGSGSSGTATTAYLAGYVHYITTKRIESGTLTIYDQDGTSGKCTVTQRGVSTNSNNPINPSMKSEKGFSLDRSSGDNSSHIKVHFTYDCEL